MARSQAEGPVVDVQQVQPPVRAEGRVVPGFGLPQAGYPWPHDGPPLMLLVELGGLLGHGESRSHQAHPAGQDIPELRELVDARLSQEAADPGHPWVIGRLEEGTALPLVHLRDVVEHLGGVRHHRAELEHLGLNPVPADHGMPVEDRAPVFQADGDRGSSITGADSGSRTAAVTMSMARFAAWCQAGGLCASM